MLIPSYVLRIVICYLMFHKLLFQKNLLFLKKLNKYHNE